MAVIRQQTKVFNQPVGVVRIDSGSQELGRVISRAASGIAETIFSNAVEEQTKAGSKAALAQPSSTIASIDPKTNMPVAYTPPLGFSEVQASAYQDMIDRRFEESIMNEIKAKGAELSQTSSSSEQYKQRMSNHVAEMFNAEGKDTLYSRFIKESGEAYVASTYSTLAKQETDAAKENLSFQQIVEGFNSRREIGLMINSGVSDETINKMIRIETRRVDNLAQTKAITAPAYNTAREELLGHQALLANRELTNIYLGLSDKKKLLFKQGLKSPEIMATFNNSKLTSLVAIAKVNNNAESLIRGFESSGKIQEELNDTEADQLYRSFSSLDFTTGSNTTVQDITNNVNQSDASDEVKKTVIPMLINDWIISNLDKVSGNNSDKISQLSNVLLSASSKENTEDMVSIFRVLGKEQAKSIASQINNLSDEDRKDLSLELSDRISAVKSIESSISTTYEDSIRNEIANYITLDEEDFSKVLKNFNRYQIGINGISDAKLSGTKKGTIIKSAGEMIVSEVQRRLGSVDLSLDSLETIQANISETGVQFTDEATQKAYDLLRPAYEISEATIRASLDARIKGKRLTINKTLDSHFLESVEANYSNASQNDIKEYDKITFGGKLLTAKGILINDKAMSALAAGVVLPTVASSIESAMFSSEENLDAALQLFDQYSNLKVLTRDGDTARQDIMRKALKPEVYSQLSAIFYASEKFGVEPLVASIKFENYDGVIDEDILLDMGLAKTKPLKQILDLYSMTPNYRNEILSAIRFQKANGRKITEESIEQIVNDYTSNMYSDPDVIGPSIDGKTTYARNIYVSTSSIIKNKNELADKMISSGGFEDLLAGGTTIDKLAENIQNVFLLNVYENVRASIGGITGNISRVEDQNNTLRTLTKQAIINIDLKYRPIESSFSSVPTYEVGYIDELSGQFELIMFNDKPWTLEADSGEATAAMRLQARNNSFVAQGSRSTKEEKIIADINYLATLRHMDEDFFLEKLPELYKIESEGQKEKYIEAFRIKRADYEKARDAD